MTPKQSELTPQKAMKWFNEIRKISLRRGGDPATKFEIQTMFKYADRLMQYQVPMPPEVDEDDRGRFTCRRCKEAMIAEAGTADDYQFCPLCGQRWREEEKERA